jgi:hypothetical protein
MHYLIVLLRMLNMGVHIEICACEVVWRVKNSGKPAKFRDILYYLNVIFLQRIFEDLKSIFSNERTTIIECTKVHFLFASQIKDIEESFLMV